MSKDFHASKRQYERSEVQGLCRVYSSIMPGSMTVKMQDISKGGAYLESKWVPSINETITCRVLDSKGAEILSTNARVAWANDRPFAGKQGFGIQFLRTLTDEQEAKVKQMQVKLVEDTLSPIRMPFRAR